MAARRVIDNAVLHTVEGIALGQRRLLNGGELALRNLALRRLVERDLVPHEAGRYVGK